MRIANPQLKNCFIQMANWKKELTINPKMMVEKNTDSSERGIENGVLETEWTYKDGKKHGLSRDWYSDGQLMMEYTYKDGKVHGLWRIWDNDGQLKIEGCTSNGEDVDMSNCQG